MKLTRTLGLIALAGSLTWACSNDDSATPPPAGQPDAGPGTPPAPASTPTTSPTSPPIAPGTFRPENSGHALARCRHSPLSSGSPLLNARGEAAGVIMGLNPSAESRVYIYLNQAERMMATTTASMEQVLSVGGSPALVTELRQGRL